MAWNMDYSHNKDVYITRNLGSVFEFILHFRLELANSHFPVFSHYGNYHHRNALQY